MTDAKILKIVFFSNFKDFFAGNVIPSCRKNKLCAGKIRQVVNDQVVGDFDLLGFQVGADFPRRDQGTDVICEETA